MTTDLQATVSAPAVLPPAPTGAGRVVGPGRATGARVLDEAWELLGDGLFTYCLSVLCDQAEAVTAVREVRRLSVRHRRRLRRPELLRAWLYALARHVCLVRMEEAAPVRVAARPAGRHSAEYGRLASLGWPEAAGVTPTQREALELAGRHGLRAGELGAVLDLRTEQAGALLAQAVCELERTAAAIAVLAAASCPELDRLGRERGPVLGPALRGELVRHVDACPTCRGTAERAAADGPWPGTLRGPVAPVLVQAPPEARQALVGEGFFASLAVGRGERQREDHREENTDPRFDRRGFPVHRTVRAERATMLRQRAVASTMIAMVVAAPVIALWVTHQGPAPVEGQVSSVQVDAVTPLPEPSGGSGAPGSVAPSSAGTAAPALPSAGPAAPGGPQPALPLSSGAPGAGQSPPPAAAPLPGAVAVSASEVAGRTVVTLVNNGGTAVAWRAATPAAWLRLSRDSGTLGPGARFTLLVTVDQQSVPTGPWTARVAIAPSGSEVVLTGPGSGGRRGVPPPSQPATPPATPPSTSAPSPTPSPSGGTSSPSPAPSGTPAPGSPPPSTSPDPAQSSAGSVPASPSGGAVSAQGRHRGQPAH